MEHYITFIIPSVNRPSLSSAINSLKCQTNPNWKAIIVYDGVQPTIKDWQDNRISHYTIDKVGTANNNHSVAGLVRNHGLRQVDITSEWIGFLDDDDRLHKDYVKILFQKYREHDLVLFKMQYRNGGVIPMNNNIVFGNVGISFCYKNNFGLVLFNQMANNQDGEEYQYFVKIMNGTSNWIIAPEIMYFVKH